MKMFKKATSEERAEKQQKVQEAMLNFHAAQLGFHAKDGYIRSQDKTFTDLVTRKSQEMAGMSVRVPMKGARAEVLDGTQWGQRMGATLGTSLLVGPFALIGTGRVIAIRITGADGTETVGTCKNKRRVQAQKFCALINSLPKE